MANKMISLSVLVTFSTKVGTCWDILEVMDNITLLFLTPPPEFAKLYIADVTGNEKLVIFHISSFPQLNVTQNQSTK